MADITEQDLENGKQDLETIEAVANGPASGTGSTVVSRLGQSIRSLAKVVQDVFDAGMAAFGDLFAARDAAVSAAGSAASSAGSASADRTQSAINAANSQAYTPNRGLTLRAMVTAALPASTLSGDGLTRTFTAQAPVINTLLDNISSPAVGDLIGDWDYTGAGGTDPKYGPWRIATRGVASTTQEVWTRPAAVDTAGEMGFACWPVQSSANGGGTIYGADGGKVFRVTNDPTGLVLGTTPIQVGLVGSINGGSGVQAQIAPLLAAVKTGNGRASLPIYDNAKNLLAWILPDKILHPELNVWRPVIAAVSTLLTSILVKASNFRLSVTDTTGRLLLEVTPNKVNHPDINAIRTRVNALPADYSGVSWIGQMVGLLGYGQSTSLGQGANPAITTSAVPGGKKFSVGVRTWDGGTYVAATNLASIANLTETNYAGNSPGAVSSGSWGETPMSGRVQMIGQLLLAENGVNIATMGQQFLCSEAGENGQTSAALANPSGTFLQRLKDSIIYGKLRADDLGQTYYPGGLFVVQGEGDYSQAITGPAHIDRWRAIQAAAEAQALATTGKARSIPMFMAQTATHLAYGRANPNIALAQIVLGRDTNVCVTHPTYMLNYVDSVHYDAASYKWAGAYDGLFAKRLMVDGVKLQPLMPLSAVALGNVVTVTYNVAAGNRLVLDTTQVAAQTNFGFQLVDAGGNPITVSSVALVGRDKVAITGASSAVGGSVRYAWVGDVNKGLGNLRDNAGASLIFDPAGINKPMHNWALISQTTIS